jgi:DNA repair exonuclease SbcCD nuclease subunit
MKIVAISDLHWDVVTLGVSRFEEVSRVFHNAVARAIRTRADAFLCCGDVYDPDSGPVVLRGARELVQAAEDLRREKIPSVFICGNHDVAGDGKTTSLDPLLGLNPELVHVVRDAPSVVEIGNKGWQMVCMPYPSSSKGWGDSFLPFAKMREPNKRAIVAGHLTIAGITPGEESAELARGKDLFWPHAEVAKVEPVLRLAGHHHVRQVTKEGIQVIGSACALTFGEERTRAQEPGFILVEVPDGA